MIQKHIGRSPPYKAEQDTDICVSLARMLNCRRYLSGEGFSELFEIFYYGHEVNYRNHPCNNVGGKLILSNGTIVTRKDLIEIKNELDRDSLLEKIISKGCTFDRMKSRSEAYARNNVVRTTFTKDGYKAILSVIDTSRERVIAPFSWFIRKPKKFAFRYDISLDKSVILDSDEEEFLQYTNGLNEIIIAFDEISPIYKQPQKSVVSPIVNQPTSQSPVQSDFINPWDIIIPSSGGDTHE